MTDLGNIHLCIDDDNLPQKKEKKKKNPTNTKKDCLNEQTILEFYGETDISNQVVSLPHEWLTTHTLKELQKIAAYYDIRTGKCNKLDIVDMIVQFENLPENAPIVHQRRTMWSYMTALLEDPKMKQLKLILLF
jgi:hypothetical protein